MLIDWKLRPTKKFTWLDNTANQRKVDTDNTTDVYDQRDTDA